MSPKTVGRKKSIYLVDSQDGTPVCIDCKVQIGEGYVHCTNCALFEAEHEIDALKKGIAIIISHLTGLDISINEIDAAYFAEENPEAWSIFQEIVGRD